MGISSDDISDLLKKAGDWYGKRTQGDTFGNVLGTVGSGLAGQVAGGFAGLGTMGSNALGLTNADPADVVRNSQSALTYTPRDPKAQRLIEQLSSIPNEMGGYFDRFAPDTAKDVVSHVGDSWDKFSQASPLAAAGITAAAQVGIPGAEEEGIAKDALETAASNTKRAARNVKKGSTAQVFDGVTDPDEALALARAGAHLKQDASGQYIGAPRGIDSPAKLGAMRRMVDQKVADGAFNADWYHRARAAGLDVSDDANMASQFSRGGAAYSPQATPPTEMNAFLAQHNAKVIGDVDAVPRTGAQASTVAKSYSPEDATGGFAIDPDAIKLGQKTGPYADAKNPTVDEGSLYKTANDIWHGRVFGYKGTGADENALFDRGFTPQEHGFLTGENLLAADRATKNQIPVGQAGPAALHTPRTMQAATWGAERFNQYKADAQAQLKAGTISELPTDAQLRARALAGIDTAIQRQVASATHEYTPGLATGHLKGLTDITGANDAHSNASAAIYGDRDPYYSALQMYQKPRATTQGAYTNSAGQLEKNPAFVSQPLTELKSADLGVTSTGKPKKGGPQLGDSSRNALDAVETMRGVLNAQEASAWNKFTPGASLSSAEQTGIRHTGTPEQVSAAQRAYQAQGLDTIRVGDGALHVGSFSGLPPKEIQRRGLAAQLQLPAGDMGSVEKGRLESNYLPINWGEQGSGSATRQLVGALQDSGIHNFAQRLDAAGLPEKIGAQNDLDLQTASQHGLEPRADLLKLRDLIKQKKLQGLVSHVKQNGYAGLPVAAGAAVGLGALNRSPRPSDGA